MLDQTPEDSDSPVANRLTLQPGRRRCFDRRKGYAHNDRPHSKVSLSILYGRPHPTSRQKLEPFCLIGAFDDSICRCGRILAEAFLKDRALISAISKELLQKWIQTEQSGENKHAASRS